MTAPTRDWDATPTTASRLRRPRGPRAVLDRLELRGDETVLDAGCGSGRVTRLLLERLPRGRVIAVDASPAMVARARERARRPRRRAPATSRRAAARRAGRRGVLERDVPLGARPRARCSRACGGAAAGRPAERPVRGRGQRRRASTSVARGPAPRTPVAEHLAGWRAVELRRPGADRGAPARGRLREVEPGCSRRRRARRAARASSRPSASGRTSSGSRTSARALPRRRHGPLGRAARARLRAAEHRPEAARLIVTAIPVTGSGRDHGRRHPRARTRWWTSSSTSASWGEFDRRPRHGAHGEVLEACRSADAVLLAAVGGPKWDRPTRASAARAGSARPAQGTGPVREPAAGAPVPRPARREPAEARAHRGHRPAGGARADRRDLLRRARRARDGAAFDTCTYSESEIERIARWPSGSRAHAGHERRQGQRARDLAALARGRHRFARRVPSVELEHLLVDNAAMQLVRGRPTST